MISKKMIILPRTLGMAHVLRDHPKRRLLSFNIMHLSYASIVASINLHHKSGHTREKTVKIVHF